MPASYPDFPRHDQIARYFDDYVEHFGLRERITFNTGVEHAAAARGRRCGRCDARARRESPLRRAAGRQRPPLEPALAGTADPRELRRASRSTRTTTRTPSQLAGRRVVVVGMGNSAMDIAVDASYHALSTTLVARRGVHVVPKYILGRPLDAGVRPSRVPFTWLLRGMQVVTRLTVGPMDRYGLPRPDHRLGQAHPTVSSRILDRLAHGAIAVKPEIAELDGRARALRRRQRERADLIVYCTGYKITFPFLDEQLSPRPRTASCCTSGSSRPSTRACTSSASSSRGGRSCRSPSAGPAGRGAPAGRVRAARAGADAAGHGRDDAPPEPPLPGLQAAHDPGGLLQLRGRARRRAPRRRCSERARRASRCRCSAPGTRAGDLARLTVLN